MQSVRMLIVFLYSVRIQQRWHLKRNRIRDAEVGQAASLDVNVSIWPSTVLFLVSAPCCISRYFTNPTRNMWQLGWPGITFHIISTCRSPRPFFNMQHVYWLCPNGNVLIAVVQMRVSRAHFQTAKSGRRSMQAFPQVRVCAHRLIYL